MLRLLTQSLALLSRPEFISSKNILCIYATQPASIENVSAMTEVYPKTMLGDDVAVIPEN